MSPSRLREKTTSIGHSCLPKRDRFLRAVLSLALLGFLLAPCAAAPAPRKTREYSENEVKAAFLYNFAKFVTWPDQDSWPPGAPLIIGVIGDDPVCDDLERVVEGKTAHGRPLKVIRSNDLAALDNAKILYLSPSLGERLPGIVEKLERRPVLTVSAEPGPQSRGVMIRFTREGSKVRFEIDLRAARRSSLNISSRLLRVAADVRS